MYTERLARIISGSNVVSKNLKTGRPLWKTRCGSTKVLQKKKDLYPLSSNELFQLDPTLWSWWNVGLHHLSWKSSHCPLQIATLLHWRLGKQLRAHYVMQQVLHHVPTACCARAYPKVTPHTPHCLQDIRVFQLYTLKKSWYLLKLH
jgi:hypothetical protein